MNRLLGSSNVKLQGNSAVIRQASPQQVATKQVIVSKGTANLIQKGGPQPQIVHLVKTSAGMTVAALPKAGNIVQAQPAVLQTQGNNTIVKLVPPNSNKVITSVKTLPSNIVQVKQPGKFVLSKGAGGQIANIGNQQVLVVSSNAAIRNIQTVTNVVAASSSKTSNFNVQPISKASVSNLQNVKITGKPIIIPMSVVGTPKTVTISNITKNTVSVSL